MSVLTSIAVWLNAFAAGLSLYSGMYLRAVAHVLLAGLVIWLHHWVNK